ncbi:hypothetical protein C6P46_003652 [Rhodotorula mucilaginosa]|uniref:Uncharacterized protein n=1 Tax=Rhodotorula mucilaginosa TaxID=5537 RepID=A0A9P7BAB7_RHOMI|nr:hypothetical protein C6P46_003652 [Rhodotorula mucilaginosa]
MHANYLGLRGQKSGTAAGGSSRYSRAASQASPSTRCQKCLGLGHYTADCTNKREYKVRPTRTQILKNPKLRTPLTESAPVRTEEMPKQVVLFSRSQEGSSNRLGKSVNREGTAAAILAANEAKRQAKLANAKHEEERGRSSRRRGSVSSSSGGSSRSSSTGQESESQPESESEQVALSHPETTHHHRKAAQHSQSKPIPLPCPFSISVKVKVAGCETSSTRISLAGSVAVKVAQPQHVGYVSLAVATPGE